MKIKTLKEERNKPLIIIFAGPTAVGKTALTLRLAREYGLEIVNADSMQVYRFMDIGTAKPSKMERLIVPHHLLDVVDPDEHFDAGIFRELADGVIREIWSRGGVPLVVGGTGLYLRVLTRGICKGIPGNPEVQKRLKMECEKVGIGVMYRRLQDVDPDTACRVHPNDRQRILRALEVFETTGLPISVFQKKHRFSESPYRALKIFLFRDRHELYGRIDRRVLDMIKNGLVDEVERLLEMGYGPDLKPMQAIGYRQMVEYLRGEKGLEEAVREIQKETRHYAKRQFTWFRKEPGYEWVHADDVDTLRHKIDSVFEEEFFSE
ncbi:tRNA (adenosine(37)-N6)-dimethylallyltransferase MiaA [Thermodesulforhabdus norvegica]|uniref:tRNA dimethylallyltransferase n=1 Tax=Thermodesulforhabdus norvegica TaxID=39841 RepID=A0A1I4VYF8_9BACT|nr:tRNA (adenosine(37)-N6)-dimethylallyltransferase MiaA [Thermodesulforhabdus norvegica]SFN06195.1 tRNA dimethylallyltransferase [Thermodesulforhabdus norvegica]